MGGRCESVIGLPLHYTGKFLVFGDRADKSLSLYSFPII